MKLGLKLGFIVAAGLALSGAARATDDFEKDTAAFEAFAKTYVSGWQVADKDIKAFIVMVKEYPVKIQWAKDTVPKYRADLQAKNERGTRLKYLCREVDFAISQFDNQTESWMKSFDTMFGRNIDSAESYSADAEKSKAPGLMKLAADNLQEAQDRINIMKAFKGDSDSSAAAAQVKINAFAPDFEKRKVAFEKMIAKEREVKMPVETYKGADKEKHRAAIKANWAKAWPGDKVVKIVFAMDHWKRENDWDYNSTGKSWSHSDMSFLAARVIVEKDPNNVTIYVAVVNKNNQTGAVSYGVQTKDNGFVVEEMPKAKMKN